MNKKADKATVKFNGKDPHIGNNIEVWLDGELIKSFNSLSDDYAITNAREYANEINKTYKEAPE